MSSGRRGRPSHPDVLTPAEWRTVDAVRHGLSNRRIAVRRGVSIDAVKFHVANAIAKLGLEGRAGLRFWTGSPLNSAQRRSNKMSDELQLGPVGQVARHVRDIRVAEAWYRDTLGLPHLYTFGDLAFFDCGGVRLFLEATAEGSHGEPSCIYFRVADIQAAYELLRRRGVVFRGAPHMIFRHSDGMEEWMAFFDDPDGQPLAIMSQPRP